MHLLSGWLRSSGNSRLDAVQRHTSGRHATTQFVLCSGCRCQNLQTRYTSPPGSADCPVYLLGAAGVGAGVLSPKAASILDPDRASSGDKDRCGGSCFSWPKEGTADNTDSSRSIQTPRPNSEKLRHLLPGNDSAGGQQPCPGILGLNTVDRLGSWHSLMLISLQCGSAIGTATAASRKATQVQLAQHIGCSMASRGLWFGLSGLSYSCANSVLQPHICGLGWVLVESWL
jgi:hypothetical protein